MTEQRETAGRYAFLHWSTEEQPEGAWTVRIADADGEVADLRATWAANASPPPLLTRYDALADLGYAVVTGGVEAWEWREHPDENGEGVFVGHTPVRPLRADELPAIQSASGSWPT